MPKRMPIFSDWMPAPGLRPRFAGQRIPLLDEVLQRYYGRIGLLIELKAGGRPGLERATAEAFQRMGIRGDERLQTGTALPRWRKAPVIVQSFSVAALERFREWMPSIPLAVLLSKEGDLRPERLHALGGWPSTPTFAGSWLSRFRFAALRRAAWRLLSGRWIRSAKLFRRLLREQMGSLPIIRRGSSNFGRRDDPSRVFGRKRSPSKTSVARSIGWCPLS